MVLNIKSIIMIILSLSIFTSAPAGCSILPDIYTDNSNQTVTDSAADSNSQPSSNDFGFRENVYKAVEVGEISPYSRMIFDSCDNRYDGISDNSQPFESNTVYFRLAKGLDAKYPVTYTGYVDEKGQQYVLCGKAGCGHTGVNCPGYINMKGDYFTLGGKLYFYSPEYYEYGDDPMDGSGKRIRLFEVTENGKELFCELKGYTGNQNGSVITDGKDLYFTAEKEGTQATFIVKIDMHSAEYSILAEMDAKYSYYKLSDITADGSQIIYTACEKPQYDYIVGVYNTYSGENTVARKIVRNKYLSTDGDYYTGDIAVVGRYIYNIDSAGRLSKRSVGAADVITVYENLNNTIDRRQYFRISHTYNNKLVINRHINDGRKYGVEEYYVLDTESLEITPLTLIGKDSGGLDVLYRVYSVTPDYFLIATNLSSRHHNRLINEMALISKTDFYRNKNNLIPVGVMYAW